MRKNHYQSVIEQYQSKLEQPTPAKSYIEEIATVSTRAISTVRAWLSGKQKPDPAALKLLAAHFNQPEDTLFPDKEER